MALNTIGAYITCSDYRAASVVFSSAVWAVDWSMARPAVSRFNGKF